MGYFLAPSLVALRTELNREFPKRDTTSDGWIGDPSHAARPSSHNPDWRAPGGRNGVVRGLDVDIDDRSPRRDLRRELLNAVVGDPRVWYVISNGIIYSVTHDWRALRYTGENAHFSHVHISVRETLFAESNTKPWFGNTEKVALPKVDLSNVREQFLLALKDKRTKQTPGIERIQRALNKKRGADLKVDGRVGPALIREWRQWETAFPAATGRPGVPDERSLKALGQGRFQVIP